MSSSNITQEGTIIIPAEGVTQIGGNEYYKNADLVNVIIREGVTKIGRTAFQHCPNLVSVKLPNSLKEIQSSAFESCPLLSDITLPDGLTGLGSDAFRGCSKLKEITIPPSITHLNDSIFSGCSSLERATLPENIEIIPFSFFGKATSLKEVNLPKGLKEIGIGAFEGCTSLTSIDLPETIEKISFIAFKGCTALSSIKLPESLTILEDCVFEDCTSLAQVELPAQLLSMEGNTFPQTTEILINPQSKYLRKKKNMILSADGKKLIAYSSDSEDITIPDGVTFIGNRAFSKNQHIKSITIPNSVEKLGNFCFEECESLQRVTLGVGMKEIKRYAFHKCHNLESINLPNALKSIGEAAFKECTSIKEIKIPSLVTEIDDEAFSNCSGLTQLTIESDCDLHRNAFTDCVKLESADLASRNIGSYAFYKCSALTSVNLKESVKSISIHAFSCCDNLKSVYIATFKKTIGGQIFVEHSNANNIELSKESPWMKVTEEAFQKVRDLAKQGDAKAQKKLGDYYFNGEGVTKNYAAAIKCYLQSAKQGYVHAQWSMAWCYTYGYGVKKDYKLALEWARLAAKQEHAGAQLLIGNFYEKGQYLMQNYEMAAKWYRKSLKNGNQDAAQRLDKLRRNGSILPANAEELNDETFGTIYHNGGNKWICKSTETFTEKETPFDIELEGSKTEGISDAQHKAYADYLQNKEKFFEEVQQKAKKLYRGANDKTKNKLIPLVLYIDREGNYGWKCHKSWGGDPIAVILSDGPVQMAKTYILYHYDRVKTSCADKDWQAEDSAYMNLFGEITGLTIHRSEYEEDEDDLSEKETELVSWLTTELNTEEIIKDVVDYCNTSYEMWCDKRITAEDLLDEVAINSIYLNVTSAEDNEYLCDIFLTGECQADEEHGISIGFRNKKLHQISEEGDAF